MNGKAPTTLALAAAAGVPGGRVVRASVAFDRSRGTIDYRVAVRGVAATNVQAVVLLRRDDRGRARVIQRLSGPAVLSAAGSDALGPLDRDALVAGRLVLSLVTTDRAPLDAPVASLR